VEYVLVFTLGIATTVLVFFLLKPALFTRPNTDYSVLEMMVEEAINQLEERQGEILAEIEEQHQALLELQKQIVSSFIPEYQQSPKVLAVLELAAQNKDVADIAKKLGLGLGEVELILELNKDLKCNSKCNS
jgi:DNA-binding NarL/FixJ family response regulator